MNLKKDNIKAIILAGGYDFWPNSKEMSLLAPLWPVAGKSVLDRLLVHLANQGIEQAAICCNGNNAIMRESINVSNCPKLKFIEESLPLGSAGCIYAAADGDKDALLLVFAASLICPPDIEMLIDAHRKGKADLTVVLNPGRENSNVMGEFAGIYVCEKSVMEYIPKDGYFDIKEGLIPRMIQAGKSVHAAVLPNHSGNFRSWQEYLCAVGNYLENQAETNLQMRVHKQDSSRIIWTGSKTDIHPSARIYGPVAVMDGACIAEDTIIFGPTILGRNVIIGKGGIVANSVLWDNVQAESNCEIQRCVVDYDVVIRNNKVMEDEFLAYRHGKTLTGAVNKIFTSAGKHTDKLRSVLWSRLDKINRLLPSFLQPSGGQSRVYIAGAVLLIVFLWSYWSSFTEIWKIWQSSDEYSSGILVPFLAFYVLWSRRDSISRIPIRPSMWGLFAFIGAQAVRFFGLFFMYSSAERLSIVLSIAALVLLIFGWELFRKVSTVLLFLCLMLPWPNRVQAALALPLQNWATSSAVFSLEMIGYEAVREGNIIHIGQTTVAIAEACNGLRMITAFFVVSGMVVLLVNRKWWEKLIVLISCLPVALLCNTVRLVITSIAFTFLTGEHWEKIFHDFGGYAMMPLALGLIVVELLFLTKLTTPPTKKEMMIVSRQK